MIVLGILSVTVNLDLKKMYGKLERINCNRTNIEYSIGMYSNNIILKK